MINTVTNTQPAQRIYSVKNKYVADIRRYLSHKQVLSNTSPYYKRSIVANALAQCNQAFTNVVNDANAYSLKKVCELVLTHKDNLRKILPVENNKSYAGSLRRLLEIITYAKQFLNQPAL